MGYIPAGRRVRLIKMEALRNTGTHPLPKKHLNMLPIPRWKLYLTRHHDGVPAQLIQKIYEVDPLICPKCGHEMKVIVVITDPHEVRIILECLKRNKAPPFDKVALKAS